MSGPIRLRTQTVPSETQSQKGGDGGGKSGGIWKQSPVAAVKTGRPSVCMKQQTARLVSMGLIKALLHQP